MMRQELQQNFLRLIGKKARLEPRGESLCGLRGLIFLV